MSDFDKNNNPEATPNDDVNNTSANEFSSAESKVTPEGQSTGKNEEAPSENSGYSFDSDGTYHYTNPRYEGSSQVNNGAAENPQQPPYYSNQGQNGYNTSGAYQQGSNGNPYSSPYQQGNQGGAPYQQGQQNAPYGSPYPYYNQQRPYAYPGEDENSGGNGSKHSGGKKKGKTIFVVIALLLCVGITITAVSVALSASGNKENSTTSANETLKGSENVGEIVTNASPEVAETTGKKGELSAKTIYNNVLASSVGILIYQSGTGLSSDALSSEGSGVIFKEDSTGEYTYIITCAHVIADAQIIMVQLSDETEYEAEIVGYDTRTDIGVLRIKAHGLQTIEIGDSSSISVGDTIYAIGNPGGTEFANSFTSGMVSAIDRPVSSSSTGYTMECIQHTAAINPGNSGGALLNSYGQLIGINSMKIVADEYEGMGFAVPSSVFVDIVNEIVSNGYVTNRAKLGITYVAASKYQSYSMFISIKGLPAGSIVIFSISNDSALKNTKAQKDDLIIAVNGTPLDDSSYLAGLIEDMSVGDKLTLTLVRINSDYSSEQFDVEVTLVEDKGTGNAYSEETTTEASTADGYYFNPFN